MNALATRALEGEVLRPDDGVYVVGRVHPLRADRVVRTVPAGLSIEEILRIALAGQRSSRILNRFDVYVDGHLIYERYWKGFRVRRGRTVTFAPVLRGEMGRTLGMLAVTALALIVAPYLAPAIFSLGLGLSVGASLAVAQLGVIVAGTVLVNALFPVRPPQSPESAVDTPNVYSIGGAQNQADPFGPIPAILGRVRVSPRYAAKPYTEIAGDDQFLRLLFCPGYGPLSLSVLKIGETDISAYEDVTIEQFEGYADDAAPTLYPGVVTQEDFSIDLTYAAGGQDRTTADNIGEFSVDFVAPGGMIQIDGNGDRSYYAVTIQVQYRLHASGNDWTTATGSYIISGKTQAAIRRSLLVGVPVRGKYDVRVTKLSGDYSGDDTVVEQVLWTALRGFRPDTVVAYRKPVALVAMRIRATAQLNNTINTFNLIAASKVRKYNESTGAWDDDQVSNNPADLFRHVLQGPANGDPLDDDSIDLEALAAWHVFCTQKGYQFNLECDARSNVRARLDDIAAAGRARVVAPDGKWSVIWDQPDSPIVQYFTPRNSWGFSGERSYIKFPHAFRCQFINEDKNFLRDEMVVYADGYNAANATLFEQREFPGVTKPTLIYKHARFHMAQALLRPETYTLSTNWQALACTIGDRVSVAHDVPMFGLFQGRVKAVATDGDGNQTVTLDQEVVMDGVKSYAIEFRLADGSNLVRSVVTQTGAFKTLSLQAPFGDLPEDGDLAMFGEADSTTVVMRVLEVKYSADLRATITFVDDAPEISTADTGVIPPFDSQISVPDDLFLLKPVNLKVAEYLYLNVAGDPSAGAQFSWEVVKAGRITGFEAMYRNEDIDNPFWELAGRPRREDRSVDITDLNAGAYSFRVRAFFDNGTASDWTTSGTQHLSGLLSEPPDVTNFRIERLNDTARLTWDEINTINLAGYVIRYSPALVGATWGGSVVLREIGKVGTVDVPLRAGTYSIKAVTSSGTLSANPTYLINGFDALQPLNVVEDVQEHPGFTGTKENVTYHADVQALKLSVTSYDLRGYDDLRAIDNLRAGELTSTTGIYYFANTIDLGQIYTSRISTYIEAVGEDTTSDFFARADFFDPADFFGLNQEAWAVAIEFRSTDDDPAGTPTWSDWQPLVLGDYSGRGFEFRAILQSLIPPVTPVVTGLTVTIDMPDRFISANDVAVPAEGLRVDFSPAFHSFKGVGIAMQGVATGDYADITAKDETGFNIVIRNAAGSGVARTLDYIARGYGGQQI